MSSRIQKKAVLEVPNRYMQTNTTTTSSRCSDNENNRTPQRVNSPAPNQQRGCANCREFEIKTSLGLAQIKNQLKAIMQILRELGQDQKPQTRENLDDDNYEAKLPMKNVDDVEQWERYLSSKSEQQNMVHYLARIGGHGIGTITKNILKKLFTDTLASLYNWEGKKNKMFSSLVLSDVIKSKASLSSPNVGKSVTEQDVINRHKKLASPCICAVHKCEEQKESGPKSRRGCRS